MIELYSGPTMKLLIAHFAFLVAVSVATACSNNTSMADDSARPASVTVQDAKNVMSTSAAWTTSSSTMTPKEEGAGIESPAEANCTMSKKKNESKCRHSKHVNKCGSAAKMARLARALCEIPFFFPLCCLQESIRRQRSILNSSDPLPPANLTCLNGMCCNDANRVVVQQADGQQIATRLIKDIEIVDGNKVGTNVTANKTEEPVVSHKRAANVDGHACPHDHANRSWNVRETGSQPLVQPAIEPWLQQVLQQILHPVAQPAVQQTLQPVAEPAVQHYFQPVSQQVLAEPNAQQVLQTVVHPATQPADLAVTGRTVYYRVVRSDPDGGQTATVANDTLCKRNCQVLGAVDATGAVNDSAVADKKMDKRAPSHPKTINYARPMVVDTYPVTYTGALPNQNYEQIPRTPDMRADAGDADFFVLEEVDESAAPNGPERVAWAQPHGQYREGEEEDKQEEGDEEDAYEKDDQANAPSEDVQDDLGEGEENEVEDGPVSEEAAEDTEGDEEAVEEGGEGEEEEDGAEVENEENVEEEEEEETEVKEAKDKETKDGKVKEEKPGGEETAKEKQVKGQDAGKDREKVKEEGKEEGSQKEKEGGKKEGGKAKKKPAAVHSSELVDSEENERPGKSEFVPAQQKNRDVTKAPKKSPTTKSPTTQSTTQRPTTKPTARPSPSFVTKKFRSGSAETDS